MASARAFARDADDLGDGEIGLDRAERLAVRRLADLVGLVGLEAVEGELVLLGEDRDRAEPQFVRRAEDTDGDFGPVGDENLGDRHASAHGKQPGNSLILSRIVRLAKSRIVQVRRAQLFAS